MTIIYVVRHGETDWNKAGMLQGKRDIPLNSRGIKQAEKCGQLLKDFPWDIIISSPLQRAKQTAKMIQHETEVSIIEMQDFAERSYGAAEGLTPEERGLLYPNKVYPNQETRESLSKRVMEGIDKIQELYDGKKILLIAHGAVINAILSNISNGAIGSGKTKLRNACISKIEYNQGKWRIHYFNQTKHLTDDNV